MFLSYVSLSTSLSKASILSFFSLNWAVNYLILSLLALFDYGVYVRKGYWPAKATGLYKLGLIVGYWEYIYY